MILKIYNEKNQNFTDITNSEPSVLLGSESNAFRFAILNQVNGMPLCLFAPANMVMNFPSSQWKAITGVKEPELLCFGSGKVWRAHGSLHFHDITTANGSTCGMLIPFKSSDGRELGLTCMMQRFIELFTKLTSNRSQPFPAPSQPIPT